MSVINNKVSQAQAPKGQKPVGTRKPNKPSAPEAPSTQEAMDSVQLSKPNKSGRKKGGFTAHINALMDNLKSLQDVAAAVAPPR